MFCPEASRCMLVTLPVWEWVYLIFVILLNLPDTDVAVFGSHKHYCAAPKRQCKDTATEECRKQQQQ